MGTNTAWNLTLPLFDEVVFVDWHGVMSTNTFWHSHAAAQESGLDWIELQRAVSALFSNDGVVVRWMKGELSTSQIVDDYLLPRDALGDRSALKKVLVDECEAVKTDRWMNACLRDLRKRSHVVLATDNMDCFVEGIGLRRDLAATFDDFISSSDVGVLKSEDPYRFFGVWMDRNGVDRDRSTLIDDSETNCVAFQELGGRAIHFSESPQAKASVLELVYPFPEL